MSLSEITLLIEPVDGYAYSDIHHLKVIAYEYFLSQLCSGKRLKSENEEQNYNAVSYTGNIMAQLNSTMTAQSDRQGIIYGDKGFLVVENINNFESVTVYNEDYKVIEKYCAPDQITGFEYQVEAAFQAIGKGEKECLQLPHKEILRVIYMMDEMRQAWGMKYPFE